MRMIKEIKMIAPVIFAAAGAVSCPAAPATGTLEAEAVQVNPALSAICAKPIPLFGAAFAGEHSFRADCNFGIPVVFVKTGSPADKIGIRPGDILLTFDGQKIFFPNQFSALLRTYNPGDVATVNFFRDGKIISKKATLVARGGNTVSQETNQTAVPAPSEKDDIRLVVNGREIVLSQDGAWRDRIAVTPDAVIIRTTLGVPDDLRRVVNNFRSRLPDPRTMAQEFKMDVQGARHEFFKKVEAFEQIFFGNGKTVILSGENNSRVVTVRDGEHEIFRGPCATQEEINAIPPEARTVIETFTELLPIANETNSIGTKDADLKSK